MLTTLTAAQAVGLNFCGTIKIATALQASNGTDFLQLMIEDTEGHPRVHKIWLNEDYADTIRATLRVGPKDSPVQIAEQLVGAKVVVSHTTADKELEGEPVRYLNSTVTRF